MDLFLVAIACGKLVNNPGAQFSPLINSEMRVLM